MCSSDLKTPLVVDTMDPLRLEYKEPKEGPNLDQRWAVQHQVILTDHHHPNSCEHQCGSPGGHSCYGIMVGDELLTPEQGSARVPLSG